MPENSHDLIVIGGGPGGYVAAIRAAQLGLNVACVEREPQLGGTCLRVGCIPSKALLEASAHFMQAREQFAQFGVRIGSVELDLVAMQKRKVDIVAGLAQGVDGLLRKNKITRYAGHGRLAGAGQVVVEQQGKESKLSAKHIVLATGSVPAWLPGVERGTPLIGSSTEAIAYDQVPKTLIVIGGGYIGLELGSVWNRLGSKVTVLEYLDRLLPGMDHELAAEAQRTFSKQGLDFRLSCRVTAARVEGGKCVVEIANGQPLVADRVLVAVGRVPNTKDLGLETAGIKPDAKGRIEVDDHYRTSAAGVYAIGDVIGGIMLAHKAEEEGVACVERIVTGYGHVNYDAIPAVVFTEPEIATVGRTEDELKAAGVNYTRGTFPFKANARARTLGHTEGFVKVLADAGTDRVLGVHIIGPHAGDLIAEATAAIEFGASSEDIARTCHAHPTLPEALKEAALAVSKRTIHM